MKHKIKNPPKSVKVFFDKKHPKCNFEFYWYRASNGIDKIYGAFVFDPSHGLIDYSHQMTLNDFRKRTKDI